MFREVLHGVIDDTKEVILYPDREYEFDVQTVYAESLLKNEIQTYVGKYCKCEYNQIVIKTEHGEKRMHIDYIKDIRERGATNEK
mgnify:CR=1 FL=1